jgi:hypothetical protein
MTEVQILEDAHKSCGDCDDITINSISFRKSTPPLACKKKKKKKNLTREYRLDSNMIPPSLFFSLFLGVLPLVAAYPKVIPGPGMPSLKSLNLTSEQLYNMPFKPIGTAAPQNTLLTTETNKLCSRQIRRCSNYTSALQSSPRYAWTRPAKALHRAIS